ncbi:MAG: helix-turn-helix transcriptional regulator [Trebonia sp.]
MTETTVKTTVTVCVMAGDPLVRQGAAAYLLTCPEISPVPPDGLDRADVVVVIAGQVGEETLSLMRYAAERVPDREMRFVLVCDGIREAQLLRALGWGMVSVLPRKEADYERVVRAVVDACEGRVEIPREAGGWLQSRLRVIERDVLEPRGLTAAGLYAREVDVLRLLAEGRDLVEIAERLNYSERTVRNIIHGVLSRLKLRNRVHAVAYALRNGAI